MDIFGRHIEFNHPEFLAVYWLALAVLYTLVVGVVGYLSYKAFRDAYADARNLNRTTRALSLAGALLKSGLYGAIAALLCITLSDPYQPNAATIVPEGTVQLAASFDVSNSMAAEDYREVLPAEILPDGSSAPPVGPWGSRLMMAKWLFTTQVIKQLPGNEMALSSFTARPWPQWAMGDDYSTIRFILTDGGWMGIGTAPGDGSDYVAGLRIAIHQIKFNFDPETGKSLYDPNKRHIIFLFTDGGLDFEDEKEQSEWNKDYSATIKEAKAINAEVIIVGMGSDKAMRVPLYHPLTLKFVDWWPFQQEKKETTRLNEADLLKLRDRLIANGIDARYVHVPTEGDAALNLDWIKAVGGTKVSTGKESLIRYPLSAVIVLFSLLMLRGLFVRSYATPARKRTQTS